MSARINHMEITMPVGSLTEDFRTEVDAFYGDVFGFTSSRGVMFRRPTLLMDMGGGSFILLIEGDQPMTAPGFDHLGLEEGSRAEVDQTLAKVKAWRGRDQRVELKEYADDIFDGKLFHAYYVRHLLPIWFDVHSCEEVAERPQELDSAVLGA